MSAEAVLQILRERGFKLAVAESLTGGALTSAFVDVPGASDVLLGGIVAYSTSLKHELLGVSRSLLEQQGAVDPEVAAQMAGGVRTKLAAKAGVDEALVVGLSTTGVAGPDSQDGKPVGTVYIGISLSGSESVLAELFSGDRAEIRRATVISAIEGLHQQLAGNFQ
jgi:nicotinamide-nucleotide amidase